MCGFVLKMHLRVDLAPGGNVSPAWSIGGVKPWGRRGRLGGETCASSFLKSEYKLCFLDV